MSSQRPTDLASNYLGGQPRMGELKISLDTHKQPEFKVSGDNKVEIRLDTGKPVKVTTRLTQCATGKDLPEYVFYQRKKTEDLRFYITFPENGWYKFMIFALDESDPAESLPNVFNYLIEVERNHKPAYPAVFAYTKFFKDSCYLDEPRDLNAGTSNFKNVKFDLKVPGAKKVAVHAVQEWFQLTNKGGDDWEGKVDLSSYGGKGSTVTVNANYDGSDSYSALLKYNI